MICGAKRILLNIHRYLIQIMKYIIMSYRFFFYEVKNMNIDFLTKIVNHAYIHVSNGTRAILIYRRENKEKMQQQN